MIARKMKIGVIGAGYLGSIHIKLLKNLKEFDLIGFFDNNAKQADAIQKEFGVEKYKDAESLMDAVDVIDIVSPTISHFEYAKKSLLKGKHVFIEKPVTSSVAQAEALIQIATQKCLKVQVGHVER
ncbi:MAG: Gfo/Idh/MocA family oxidoreductase, partial [Flavobacteriales bacterium]|nr:Gfo/Idh/MocA family oxidoreductase [Flavobacteriales bacterium]